MKVTLLKGISFKILWEYFFLKNFGDSKFSSPFHFEPFEFFNFVVKAENHISFL